MKRRKGAKKLPALKGSGRQTKYPAILEQRIKQEQEIIIRWSVQLALDIVVGILNDPSVMGKDVFGAKRLSKIGIEFNKRFPEYFEAITKSKEADYVREKIDREQKRIFGKGFAKWSERYEFFED